MRPSPLNTLKKFKNTFVRAHSWAIGIVIHLLSWSLQHPSVCVHIFIYCTFLHTDWSHFPVQSMDLKSDWTLYCQDTKLQVNILSFIHLFSPNLSQCLPAGHLCWHMINPNQQQYASRVPCLCRLTVVYEIQSPPLNLGMSWSILPVLSGINNKFYQQFKKKMFWPSLQTICTSVKLIHTTGERRYFEKQLHLQWIQ